MSFNLLLQALLGIAKGIPTTLALVFTAGLVGIVIAILVNVCRKYKSINAVLQLYVMLFTGTPLFLQLFFIYYGLGSLVSNTNILQKHWFLQELFRTSFIYALIAMALNTGAYGSGIIKAAISAIPEGQLEAAKALGLGKWQTFKRILLPQAFYYALPSYSNELILLVKASSLASVITVMDITGYMQQIFSATYSFYEPFIAAAIYYLIINYTIILLVKRLERKANLWLNHSSMNT